MTNIYSSNSRLSYLIESIHFYYLFCGDRRRPLIIESQRVSKLLGTFIQLYLISRHFIPDTFVASLSIQLSASHNFIIIFFQLSEAEGSQEVQRKSTIMGSSSSIVRREQVGKQQLEESYGSKVTSKIENAKKTGVLVLTNQNHHGIPTQVKQLTRS